MIEWIQQRLEFFKIWIYIAMTKRKRERRDKVIVRPMLDHSDWVFVFLDASSCPVKAEHYELVFIR